MKNDPRRFAPLGLLLSGLAVVSFIVFLIIRGLALAGLFTPPDPLLLERGMWISLSVLVLGIALYAFIDPDRARRFVLGRQVQYGSNAIIMLLAFGGILIFLNILAYQNPLSWDVTESQKNTLAPETINLLKTLPGDIAARAYFSPRTDSSTAKKLLDNFKQFSAGKFSYQFIDPVNNPLEAQQDGVDRDGTIVLQMGVQKEPVTTTDEQSLAIGMVRLLNPTQENVYFLTGHGEADIQQAGDSAYTLVKAALQNKNYLVNTLSDGKIPDNARVVVVAGPQTALSSDEVKILKTYLDNGGSLLVMEDPAMLTKVGTTPDPLADLIASWGIKLQNDIMIDPNANPALLVYADPLNYGQHPITDKLRGLNSKFLNTQSLLVGTAPQGVTLTPLATTYKETWGETDQASINNNQVSFDPTKDHAGPLVLAAAGENPSTKSRLVVFGDSGFAADALYKIGNGDIFINSVDWLAQKENLISLTPRNNISRTFNPPGNVGLVSMILVSICLIPILVIIGGVTTWVSRRRRG